MSYILAFIIIFFLFFCVRPVVTFLMLGAFVP